MAEDPVQKIFNFHFWRKYSFIPRKAGDMESEWNLFKAFIAEKDCFKLWLECCWLLLRQQPKNMLVREAVKKKVAFWVWLTHGSSNAANRYRQARGTVATVVVKAKNQVL